MTDLFDCCFGGCINYYPEFSEIDKATFGIIAAMVLFVFLKKRWDSKTGSTSGLGRVNPPLDILMQPKKEILLIHDRPPFSQFSAATVYTILGIVAILPGILHFLKYFTNYT